MSDSLNSNPSRAAGMLCPVCKVALSLSDRQGIEIDYCPQCRGVWLDRGELDKIIERSDAYAASAAPAPTPAPAPYAPAPYAPGTPAYDPHYRDDHHRPRHGGRHDDRRGGFFGRLFEHH